jgi:hypothetical protein
VGETGVLLLCIVITVWYLVTVSLTAALLGHYVDVSDALLVFFWGIATCANVINYMESVHLESRL